MKDYVKVQYEGVEYYGTFNHWFNCDLSGDKVGVVDCNDGEQRAFPFSSIQDDNEGRLHHIGCNCYHCL